MSEEDFPPMKRRWNVTIFRNEPVESGIKNMVAHEYKNVRSKCVNGEIVDYERILCFVDETGREVVASSVPFIATEVTPPAALEEIQSFMADFFDSIPIATQGRRN